MPQPASAVTADAKLRLVVLGSPKAGKSTTVIGTAPGPAYVIATDGSAAALQGAARMRQDFSYDLVHTGTALTNAMREAAKGAAAGAYATVVLDTLSSIGGILELEELAAAGNDGRRAYSSYARKMRYIVRELFKLPCHVILTSHYIDTGDGIDGKAHQGRGIFPLLAGQARETVAALCHDVCFLELRRDGSRVLVCNPVGVWGAGMKSLAAPNVELPPDITKLIAYMRDSNQPAAASTANP